MKVSGKKTKQIDKQEPKQSITFLRQTFPRYFLLTNVRTSNKYTENKQFIKENRKIIIINNKFLSFSKFLETRQRQTRTNTQIH